MARSQNILEVMRNSFIAACISGAGLPEKVLLEAGMAYVTFASEHPNVPYTASHHCYQRYCVTSGSMLQNWYG